MGKSINYGEDKLHYREFILYKFGSAFPEYRIDFKRSAANVGTSSDAQSENVQTAFSRLKRRMLDDVDQPVTKVYEEEVKRFRRENGTAGPFPVFGA
ncbi:unnamed protein product [Rotaria sp. Silwood1]|nr:unnamed protein product [Rotaria sp. Silwood1]